MAGHPHTSSRPDHESVESTIGFLIIKGISIVIYRASASDISKAFFCSALVAIVSVMSSVGAMANKFNFADVDGAKALSASVLSAVKDILQTRKGMPEGGVMATTYCL